MQIMLASMAVDTLAFTMNRAGAEWEAGLVPIARTYLGIAMGE